MKISASFLSIKEDIKKHILELDKTTIDYLHLDIMDGCFVENKTWNINEVKDWMSDVSKPLDIHLMVGDVTRYIDEYKTLNPFYITFHLEAVNAPLEIIDYIKKDKIKVGISIKPNTAIEKVKQFLPYIDLILVMSVEPGKGGQEFIENTIYKIEELYEIRNINGYNYLIEVDGGINDKTSLLCEKADILVVGSYITNSDDYQSQVDILKK